MHVHFLDPYRPKTSPVTVTLPAIKLLLTVFFILTNTLLPVGARPIYILLFALMLSVELLSNRGVGRCVKKVFVGAPICVGCPTAHLDRPFIIIIQLSYWPLEYLCLLSGTGAVCQYCYKIMALNAGSHRAGSQHLFPYLIGSHAGITCAPTAGIHLWVDVALHVCAGRTKVTRLMRARASRSGQSDLPGARLGRSISWRARVTGGMAGSLFLRAFERSDRIYMAMVSRGYDGEVHSLPLPDIQPAHWVVLVSSLGLLGVLLGFAYLFWG